MADRIGKNREFLGVHFPSDTEASEKLAEKVVELLKGTSRFKEILVRARSELFGMERVFFTVILTKAGSRKDEVINVVQDITKLDHKDAQALVEGAPKPVKENISEDAVAKIKKMLEDVGATVKIK